jgi:hypothetical protein
VRLRVGSNEIETVPGFHSDCVAPRLLMASWTVATRLTTGIAVCGWESRNFLDWVFQSKRFRNGTPCFVVAVCPALLGLLNWLILVTHRLRWERSLRPRRAAWYVKTVTTFADVLACVRHTLLDPALPFLPVPGHPRHPKMLPAAARTAAGRPLLLGLKHARPLGARTDFVQSRTKNARHGMVPK